MPRKPRQQNTIYDDARKEALKQFRHSIKELKKAGLVSKKYDARKVKQTKYLKSVIKKFRDVLAGEAKVVKVSTRKKKNEYKDVGYKTRGAKQVIVPVDKGQRVRVNKKDEIIRTRTMKNVNGIGGTLSERMIPVQYKNLPQWLRDMVNSDLDSTLEPGERWAFQFWGKNSLFTFPSIEKMIEYLERYEAVQKVINERSASDMMEVYQHITILKTNKKVLERSPRQKPTYKPERRRAQYERKMMRIDQMSDKQYDDYVRSESAKRQDKRNRLKENNPEKYREQLDKQKARSKTNYAKKKAAAAKRKPQ